MYSRQILTIALLCLSAFGCQDSAPAPEPAVPRVKVLTVGKESSGQSRRFSGKVQAADRSPLSFGVGGQVLELLVDEGQLVSAGQLLARLDNEPSRLKLRDGRAQLTSSRAKEVEARAAYDRAKRLVEGKAASRKSLEAAKASLAGANSSLKAATAAVEQAERDLQRTKLTAPFPGRIVSISVDPFQDVSGSEIVLIMQSVSSLEVDLRVPETMIRLVEFGQPVQVGFPSLEGVSVTGTVSTIGAETEAGNAFPVLVRLPKSEADLRPGMTASVTFNFAGYLDGRTAYLVPLSALAIEAGLRRLYSTKAEAVERQAPVFVYDAASGTVQMRQVNVGDLRGNEIEVFDGLEAGEQVVTAGVAFLRDGMSAMAWAPRGVIVQ